jgi:hypothetical protein
MACSIAPARSPGRSTRIPSAPHARASATKSGFTSRPSFSRTKLVAISRLANIPSWMSRMPPYAKLFQITQTAGMSYSTAVQSTSGRIMKPPSPQTVTQGRSGAASLAPSTPHTPNPMAPKPQLLSSVCGRRARQNWTIQL